MQGFHFGDVVVRTDATHPLLYREFVADSVIQASGTVEFEDGLRTGVLLQDC